MRLIGITGGAGAGKSEILRFMEKEYPSRVLFADEMAHELMQPGTECFAKIKAAFAKEGVFTKEGILDSKKMAELIFTDGKKREMLNGMVHPEVKREVLRQAESERRLGKYPYLILEAALLIEDGYDAICDELWYIDAPREERRSRLKRCRGYSDEKIDAIFASQLPEEVYRQRCDVVICNHGMLEEAFHQIRARMGVLEQG